MVEYTLHIDKLRDIAVRGTRRAAIFMGLATNAVRLDPPLSHALDDSFRTVIVPEKVSDQTKRHFLAEFEKSVIANGLRELVDTFALFLVEVHGAVAIAHRAQAIPLFEGPTPSRPFDRESVTTQLERLHMIFGTEFELSKMFSSLVTARNCLTHNLGIVRKEDCNAADELSFELHWRKMAAWAETADGKILAEFEPGSDKGMGTHFTEETTLKVQFRDFAKPFAIGSPIEISRQELAQICLGVTSGTDLVIQALIAHLTKLGVLTISPSESSPDQGEDV